MRDNDDVEGITTTYTYDAGGNITWKRIYEYAPEGSEPYEGLYALPFSYNNSWRDMLVTYKGRSITYDGIGTPLTYRDGMSFTWERGRRLATFSKAGVNASYTYDDNGIRTGKTVNGVKTDYYLNGSTILTQISGDTRLDFFYDENGSVLGFKYGGGIYLYRKNICGDITGIENSENQQVCGYRYDAWGNILEITGEEAETIGKLNPFRYRGYYYDEESGLYYLNSRYYDPEVGRFVNADGIIAGVGNVQGYNLFVYCNNNPINRVDSIGYSWEDVFEKIKKATKMVASSVKKIAYSAYYVATYFHFEGREQLNGVHPSYSEVTANNSNWKLLPQSQSIYHDNGYGKPEEKYITDDGREAVFDGDTLLPMEDPKYIATYNYYPPYQFPKENIVINDYCKLAITYLGHFEYDVLPYYLTGKSNTRKQFEEKIFIFN